jgi:hypothetical protein
VEQPELFLKWLFDQVYGLWISVFPPEDRAGDNGHRKDDDHDPEDEERH